jgi:hypothetical protein
MSLVTMPRSSLNSLSVLCVSGTEQTCFTADCPYCQWKLDVEIDPTLGGLTGGCINKPGCRCRICAPFNFVASCCPSCKASITMTVKLEGNRLSLEFVQPAPWCRLHLAAPKKDVGRARLSSQPPGLPPPGDVCRSNPYLEALKQKGYLSVEECYGLPGQLWNGNLYWERCCPKCRLGTQIRFTPFPKAVNLPDLDGITRAERESLDTFFKDFCGRPIEDLVHCPHCYTLLAIKLSFIAPSGGLYMAQWHVATDQEPQLLGRRPKRLQYGESGEFFNQFAIAQGQRKGYNL